MVGNAILWGVTAVAVGYGAYQKHQEGKLDWKLAGTVAAGLGALAAGDYYASQYVVSCPFEASDELLTIFTDGFSRTSTLPNEYTTSDELPQQEGTSFYKSQLLLARWSSLGGRLADLGLCDPLDSFGATGGSVPV